MFNAANAWLGHCENARVKYAKNLLLKVRFVLLSDDTFRYILEESSPFTKLTDCIKMVKQFLKSKEDSSNIKHSCNYNHRYCNNNKFNFLLCGGGDVKTG